MAGKKEFIQLYAYKDPFSRETVTKVLHRVSFDALTHGADTLIGLEPLQTWVDEVQLILILRKEENLTNVVDGAVGYEKEGEEARDVL